MALYHVAKFSTPLPTNLISTRSQYGREIANVQIPLPSWQSVPNPSFVELTSGLVYACGTDVSNYSAATDEFRVTPTYSLPAWLSLTTIGSGAGNLTTNGNQLDANDIPANPGITIDVRRSGGAWVSSQPFGVTVTATSPSFPLFGTMSATITRLDKHAPTVNVVIPVNSGQNRDYEATKTKIVNNTTSPVVTPIMGNWGCLISNPLGHAGEVPIVGRKAANYRACYRLTSDRPLAAARAPLRGLTLHRGDQLLIADLPGPPIRNHTALALTAGSEPRDALYSVLEY